jgi:hypothetical protein
MGPLHSLQLEEHQMKGQVSLQLAYAKLVAATWQDDSVLAHLKQNPVEVLNKYGLKTKAGATVQIDVVEPTGEGNFQSQLAAWVLGDRTGKYTLWIPEKPQEVPGSSDDGCTCTPCCSCT